MNEKVKIGGVDFDVINTVESCHDIAREIGIPWDAQAPYDKEVNPLILKLNGKIRLMQHMRKDIKFYTEINEKVAIDEFKPEGRKQIAQIKRKLTKTMKESIEICKELGWIK